MDIKEIRRLIKLMVDNDLSELHIDEGERGIHLKRGGPQAAPVVVPTAPAAAPAAAPTGPGAAETPEPGDGLIEVRSPMVGTIYVAPSPDSDAFVAVGASVSPDTVVCIVEAMKVMNEIKAECSGTVAEICVKNAQPVEYGQVLFRVTPV